MSLTRSTTDQPRALNIERLPVEIRTFIDDEAARDGFTMRTVTITMLREAMDARKAAAR